ncbi:MAG: hypothetical protein U1F11_11040 [Steroidobacteraceae bacterium]
MHSCPEYVPAWSSNQWRASRAADRHARAQRWRRRDLQYNAKGITAKKPKKNILDKASPPRRRDRGTAPTARLMAFTCTCSSLGGTDIDVLYRRP